ncbi:hypothetical protein NPIL_643011 [Nephila pilipes]|uniref:Uncharacterized protein n=1 Tax=Nephila pilipes TaxID=299642 RepID=A0A8X6UPG7_NEPPI|nr:hypothetical protein NPIL_643011 [Nephila pilipes]
MYSAHIIGESFSSSSFYENLLALLSPYKDEMSDSENSSLLEEKNKDAVPGQEDSPKLESIDMTLGTGTAPKNATDPSKGLREDSKETTAASPSSERQTKKSILQSDLESIEKVTGSIKKSTNTAGDQPVESPSRHARKPSYSKKGGRTERYSKKEKPKTNTFKQVSEDECTVQTSDRGSASAAEKRTKSKSDASKPSFVDTSIKSIDEQALSSGRNVSIESPTKKKSDMSRSTKPDSVQRRSHPTMEPRKTAENSRSFSSPSRSAQPSPKKIAKSFQTLSSPSLVAQIEKLLPPSRKIAQRSQTLSPPSRTAQQSPKKIAESSQTFSPPSRTAQTSRKIAELSRIFLSPSEFASRKSSKISRTLSFPSRSGQPSTRKQNRSLPQEESVSFQLDPVDNGKENTRTSNVRESEKPTSATSNKGTESSNRVGHSPGRYYAAPLPLKSVKSIIKKFEGMRLLVDKTTEAGGNERRPEKLEDKQKRTTATRTSPAKVPSNSKTRILLLINASP